MAGAPGRKATGKLVPLRRAPRPRPLDAATAAAGMARPGNDTRQWVSLGLVYHEDPKQIVQFDDEAGCPLVSVLLQPSNTEVLCRVGGTIAGNGEGEYHPFVLNDEVLVVLPAGLETFSPIIVARLNNAHDRFPMTSVAGQDPTTNTFAFRRRRTPFIEELAGPIMLRTAPAGAFLSIDLNGVVTLRDGDANAFQVSADQIGWTSSDGAAIMQYNLTGKQILMQMGGAYLQLSSSPEDPNAILCPGSLTVATSGNTPAEHVATTEAVVLLLRSLLTVIGPMFTVPILPGSAVDAIIAGIVTASAAGYSPSTDQLTIAALLAAFNAPVQKPPALGIQLQPGVGCLGFMVG